MGQFRYVFNQPKGTASTGPFNCETAENVRKFHRSFPEYRETPLVRRKALAESLGIRELYVKDESYRFDLNAFKVLGGSYAIGSYIAGRLGRDLSELTAEKLLSPEVREKLGPVTFVTATDGNHGRGVAWTANRLHQKCVVYMPAGTAQERLDNILALGADASITELSYDDDVRLAAANAEKYGWVVIQDTSGEDYEEIPEKIMQGYTTMALEAVEQLEGVIPTHVFLQAGVGSMAGAVAAFLTEYYGTQKPRIIVVEPNSADCMFRTACASDGQLHRVEGEMHTMMAGLACGEPCPIAWKILDSTAECFVTMEDESAAKAMRLLAGPAGTDKAVVSGESGAAGVGAAQEILTNPGLRALKEGLALNENSVVLCFSTEGATDRSNYDRILREV